MSPCCSAGTIGPKGPIVPAEQHGDIAQTKVVSADSIDSFETENLNAIKFKLKTKNLNSSVQSQSNTVNHDVKNNNTNYLTADRLDTENLNFYFKSDLSDNQFSEEEDAEIVNHRIAVNRPPPSSPSSPGVGELGNARGSL